MNQIITCDVAKTLKKGDTLYNNIIEFDGEDGKVPATATVMGKVKIGGGVEQFHLPIRHNYGAGGISQLTKLGGPVWRTTPEKIVPTRIHRVRSAPLPESVTVTTTGRVSGAEEQTSNVPKAGRVRRSR